MLGIVASNPRVWCAHCRLWQWHVQGSFFFLALCSLWLQTGPDARHHGRFGPEEQVHSCLVSLYGPLFLAVTCSIWFLPEEYSTCLFWEKTSGSAVFSVSGCVLLPVYVFLGVLIPYSAQCLVLSGPRYALVTEFASSTSLSWRRGSFPWSCCSADHSNSPVAALGPVVRVVLFFRVVALCVQRQVPSTAALHQQRRLLPFRGADAHPHDEAVQRTIEIPLLPCMWWFMSLFTGRAFFPVVVQRQIPMVQTVLQTTEIPQSLFHKVLDLHVVLVVRVRQVQDSRDPTVASRWENRVPRRPDGCALHVVASLNARRGVEVTGGFFLPCAQAHGLEGVMFVGTWSHNKMHLVMRYR